MIRQRRFRATYRIRGGKRGTWTQGYLGPRRAGWSLEIAAYLRAKVVKRYIFQQRSEEVRPVPPIRPCDRARFRKPHMPHHAHRPHQAQPPRMHNKVHRSCLIRQPSPVRTRR